MSVIGSNILAGASGNQGYFLTNSLRFRASASAYLSRTFVGTPQTYTYSCWFKRGTLGTQQELVASRAGTASFLELTSSDTITCGLNNVSICTSTAVFRDPSAWYHVVLTVTQSSTVTIYVNNVSVATGAVGASSFLFNSSYTNTIGQYGNFNGLYFDGYMTEINFIDGQALTPSSFGQTSSTTGVWQPIKYTGTYGTNGFYLPFTDNSALTTSSNAGLGKDFSGNANYWTTNNISITSGETYDSMTDVPTLTSATVANYAVLNPIYKNFSQPTFSDGNLSISSNTANYQNSFATIPVTSGKWYCELTLSGNPSSAIQWGASNATQLNYLTGTSSFIGTTTGVGYAYVLANGDKYTNGTQTAYGNALASGDILGIALDLDNSKIFFSKNGTWQASGDPAAGTNAAFTGIASDTWFIGGDVYTHPVSGANTMIANFGQRPFAYTPPTDFKALNTFNLPTPTIGATASSQANKYMDATIWTGDNTTPKSITNSGSMQPDFVWIKSRSDAYQHNLYDSVRGAGAAFSLSSDQTAAEGGNSNVYGFLSAFNSNGFAVTQGTAGGGGAPNGNAYTNQSGSTYVAWQWRASNATAVSNTAGSITSTVSASTTAGFSIVTYTGTGSVATIGHGLGVAPSMIICKNRTGAANDWMVWNSNLPSSNLAYLNLNDTGAVTNDANLWNSTNPSSTVFSVGTSSAANGSGTDFVAYCFAPVAGYSAFGSYTGNGSTDGPFVFTGFRPRYVMIKRTDTGGTDWVLLDSSRDPTNVVDQYLAANLSDAETVYANDKVDFLSNGFKQRGTASGQNGSGGTFIYMAFAENPFKYANAR